MPRGAQEAAEGQNTSKKPHLFLSKKSPKNVCLARVCVGRPGMLSEENRSLCGLGCSAEIETHKRDRVAGGGVVVYVAWDAPQRLKPLVFFGLTLTASVSMWPGMLRRD